MFLQSLASCPLSNLVKAWYAEKKCSPACEESKSSKLKPIESSRDQINVEKQKVTITAKKAHSLVFSLYDFPIGIRESYRVMITDMPSRDKTATTAKVGKNLQ